MNRVALLILTIFCFTLLYFFNVLNFEEVKNVNDPDKKSTDAKIRNKVNLFDNSLARLSVKAVVKDSQIKIDIINALKKCMGDSLEDQLDKDFYETVELSIGKIDREEPVWTNIHIEKNDGHNYRIRVFNADLENGTVQKLVYFKDDDQGYPQILKKHLRPSRDLLNKYLKNGRVLYDEIATRYVSETGLEIFVQKINDEIKRVNFNFNNKQIDCRE